MGTRINRIRMECGSVRMKLYADDATCDCGKAEQTMNHVAGTVSPRDYRNPSSHQRGRVTVKRTGLKTRLRSISFDFGIYTVNYSSTVHSFCYNLKIVAIRFLYGFIEVCVCRTRTVRSK